jgi:serine/threonine protein phosphatase PrpC
MKRISFNATSVGSSHIKKNKPCQDYSERYEAYGYRLVVVSDGHGGDDYVRSDKGSEFAVGVAVACTTEFMRSIDDTVFDTSAYENLKQLAASIISNWNDRVSAHLQANPFTEQELTAVSAKAQERYKNTEKVESAYGATLLIAVVTDHWWFGLHIGDGKCVVKDYSGTFSQPIPWDEKCFLNATTSICDTNALENFRYYYSKDVPAAVFLGSDGIDDCFANDGQLHGFYDALIALFARQTYEDAVSEIKDYIPRMSAKGSGDDMSVAGILDIEHIAQYVNPKYTAELEGEDSTGETESACRTDNADSADRTDSTDNTDKCENNTGNRENNADKREDNIDKRADNTDKCENNTDQRENNRDTAVSVTNDSLPPTENIDIPSTPVIPGLTRNPR